MYSSSDAVSITRAPRLLPGSFRLCDLTHPVRSMAVSVLLLNPVTGHFVPYFGSRINGLFSTILLFITQWGFVPNRV